MRAGNLRERITLQEQKKTRDPATMQNLTSWVNTCLVSQPAEIVLQTATESNSTGQVVATARYTVIIRRHSSDGIREDMRILWRNKCGSFVTLYITGVGYDPLHRQVVIQCTTQK